jgi:hypothetical protein
MQQQAARAEKKRRKREMREREIRDRPDGRERKARKDAAQAAELFAEGLGRPTDIPRHEIENFPSRRLVPGASRIVIDQSRLSRHHSFDNGYYVGFLRDLTSRQRFRIPIYLTTATTTSEVAALMYSSSSSYEDPDVREETCFNQYKSRIMVNTWKPSHLAT